MIVDRKNKELELAWKIIANTDTHLFLTGKAGTGKTTFLRNLRRNVPKRMVVLAPTGIAAINAEGVTIHSFFQLPFGPQIPNHSNVKRYAFRRQKLRLIRTVDLIVIDEISMVRADLLDAIDSVLRQYRDRNRPFGGVQMLMIGDMQQLAPVAKDDEWNILRQYYDTPYFFSSKALRETNFVTVELMHVYRQSDPVFINLLNQVRNNTAGSEILNQLNKRYIPNFNPNKEEGYIRLVTHNNQADCINKRELDALPTPPFCFHAHIEGEFPELSYPTDEHLILKVGTQVMFIRNDSSPSKRYYNGMIGEVTDITDSKIKVLPVGEQKEIEVQPEEWTNVKYEVDEKSHDIVEVVVGRFQQQPLKAAWAITVHKSQGLTFDKAIIDVQYSFAHGQTYVALSRCKSLDGMVLATKIPPQAIISDKIVETFQKDTRSNTLTDQQLDQMQRHYMLRITEELFSFMHLRYGFNDMERLMREYFYDLFPMQYKAWKNMSMQFKDKVETVAVRFHTQYQNIILTHQDYEKSPLLQERIMKGAAYFEQQLCDSYDLLKTTSLPTDNQAVADRLNGILTSFRDNLIIKLRLMNYVAQNGISIQPYLQEKAKVSLEIDGKEIGSSASKKGVSSDGKKVKKDKKVRMIPEIPPEVLHKELFSKMVEWRKAEAEIIGRPAFVVMTQKSLMGIVNLLPSDYGELKLIPGIGSKFMEKYAETVLRMVSEAVQTFGYEKPKMKMVEAETMTQSYKEEKALEKFLSGIPVDEIATEFMVTESTVYNYLIPAIKSGRLSISQLFEQDKIATVNKCLDNHPDLTNKEILEILGREDFGYSIINCCKALRTEKD